MDVDVDVDVDMRVIAIDPGVTGALAVVVGKPGDLRVESVADLPVLVRTTASGKTRRSVDGVALADMVRDAGAADGAVVERLVAPPGVASNTAFSLGATAATCDIALRLAGYEPVVVVSPNVWKLALGAPAAKQEARRFATKLFGSDAQWRLAMHHNRAEAALIGAWYVLTRSKQ